MNGQGYYRSRIEFNLFFMFQHLGSPLAFSSFIIHVSFLILNKNIEFAMISKLHLQSMWARAPLLPFLLLVPLLLVVLAPSGTSAQQVVSILHFFCDCICGYIFTNEYSLLLRRQTREKRAWGVNAILTNTIYFRGC